MFNMPEQLTVYNPATGEAIESIPQQTAEDVEKRLNVHIKRFNHGPKHQRENVPHF